MGRYVWNIICKLVCLIFVVWLIFQSLGISLIDWIFLENIMISFAPLLIMFIAIIYIIMNVFS